MLDPLKTPIQSEAIFKVYVSKSDSETLKAASDWIGVFKGPNVCVQRFSGVLPLRLTLVHEREKLWFPGHRMAYEAQKTIDGLAGNGLLKTYTLSMEDKMAADAFGHAKNYG